MDKFADIGQQKCNEALKKYNTSVDDKQIKEVVTKLINSQVEENNTLKVKKFLLGSVELTTLKTTDSEESVLKLVEKVNKYDETFPHLPHFASICVYPCFAQVVSQSLQVDDVEVACVSGSFPSAQSLIEVKVAETALAVNDGATEIDMVMSVGKFLSQDYATVCEEVTEIKAVCGEKKLKIILETGCLENGSQIKIASILAMYAGADFIKTSTGKESIGATPEAAYIICQAIKEYYKETGIQIGLKVAGGLNTVHDAIVYYTIVKEVLGEKWITNEYFRLGTSRLTNLLLSEIEERKIEFF